jgi:MFS family permease
MKNENGIFSLIQKRVVSKIKEHWKADKNMFLFAFEGIIIALVTNIINNNNNLFATRLGANNFELTLVTSLPQFVGMLVLIPGGILADRMTNKRKMVAISLLCLSSIYMTIGFVPMFGRLKLIAFIGLLAISVGPLTLYNASWQAYFSDVVHIEDRNRVFTLRTKGTFLFNIVTPLATGALLANAVLISNKIKLHQVFFWSAALLLWLQIFVLKKISGGDKQKNEGKSGFKEFRKATFELIGNKRLMCFFGVALFFYMFWQIDWTLYFIGQVEYLKLNEAWLSYVVVGGALVQFLTIGFWSRMNEKYGVRVPIIIGSLALSLFPLCMNFSTSLPVDKGAVVFLVLSTLSNFAFATITLNIPQCLLQVVPEKNKTLSISIYTVLTSLSNAVMPLVGVQLYTALGSNLEALHTTYFIIFIMRIIAASLWIARWWVMRKEPIVL